ncbi:MAG TPA: YdeI/OmpD-associated family protein, partial [Candidatus Aquilonibacter sp.]
FTQTFEGSGVAIPVRVMQAFAPRKRVPVRATINGHTYRTTICDMGTGPMIPVRKSVAAAAGAVKGKRIAVAIELDEGERTVELPADLLKAMTKAERDAFATYSYTHRREYVEAIAAAKRPETRARRISLAVEAARKKLR